METGVLIIPLFWFGLVISALILCERTWKEIGIASIVSVALFFMVLFGGPQYASGTIAILPRSTFAAVGAAHISFWVSLVLALPLGLGGRSKQAIQLTIVSAFVMGLLPVLGFIFWIR